MRVSAALLREGHERGCHGRQIWRQRPQQGLRPGRRVSAISRWALLLGRGACGGQLEYPQ